MDPRTGRPVQGVLSVAVLTATATDGDALDNVLFVQGPEDGAHGAGAAAPDRGPVLRPDGWDGGGRSCAWGTRQPIDDAPAPGGR